MLRPDVIVLNNPPRERPIRAATISATRRWTRSIRRERRIMLPPRYTICGGAALVEAFDYLTALLTRLAQSPTMRTN